MIYFVTNQLQIEYKYTKISIEDSINILMNMEEIAVDTETTGLDCFLDRLFMLQLGNEDIQIVIDINNIDINRYREVLETKPLVLQNAKFDLSFFYVNNIKPTKVYDTMLAEQVLYNGLNPIINLAYLAKKYCSITLDKSQRLNPKGIITNSYIKYGADDIKVLPIIKEKQLIKAKEKKISRAIDLENKFVLSLAYSEFCGIYLSREKWTKKYLSAKTRLKEIEDALNDYIIKNEITKYIDNQLDLFSTKKSTTINWSSSKQVIPLFEDLGINVKSEEAKSGKSINAKILEKQKELFEILPIYLKYQGIKKEFTTYGEKFLNHINPITNRIHTSYNQLMDTGRLSSTKPNTQNIPSDEITRGCFIPQSKENILIDVDYTAQEDVLFVNFSEEPKMITFYKGDFSDGHSYVASLCFPDELSGIEMKNIKKERPDLRFLAKSAKFAIHYAGTGYTIANNLNLSEKRGEEIYNAYLKAFPGIDKYLKKVIATAKHRGYITISKLTNRKYWAKDFNKMDYKEKANFAKLAANYPIQGSAAETVKIASILLYKWILANNYFNIVKISGFIHDEILLECPKNISKEVANKVQECMEKAGTYFCPIIPLKAVPEIAEYWTH